MATCGKVCDIISRRKTLELDMLETPLSRCLSTFDLTLLGVGGMIGAGLYVLTGTVAQNTAGPAVVLSFVIAGFASLLAALCYAEFGAQVPKAGSAYVYTYVTVGELWAFLIGWNIVLEHLVGAASVSRAWSGYLDELLSNRIRNFTYDHVTGGPMDVPLLAEYPDFLAFFLVLLLSMLVSLGAHFSAKFNHVFAFVNMAVVVFVVIAGATQADTANWTEHGGFTPYGFNGVVSGAAACFYAFVGFDIIATSGEEAKTPGKSIPIAICASLLVASVSYISVSLVLTLMVPYDQIKIDAALPDAFRVNGLAWAEYVVGIGAIAGMTTSLLSSMFAMPRCVYAMAADGLLFSWLARVNEKSKVPVITTIVFGFIAATMALIFGLDALVEFMSIGTLLAYTIVSASVIVLRYRPIPVKVRAAYDDSLEASSGSTAEGGSPGVVYGSLKEPFASSPYFSFLAGLPPGVAVSLSTLFLCCLILPFGAMITFGSHLLSQWWAVILVIFLSLAFVALVLVICMHIPNNSITTFKVPFVPFIPLLSIIMNLYLMLMLNYLTWIRFAVWVGVGILVYVFYGVWHSKERALQAAKREADYLVMPDQSNGELTTTPSKNIPPSKSDTLASLQQSYQTFNAAAAQEGSSLESDTSDKGLLVSNGKS